MNIFPSPRQRGKSLVMRLPWQLFALENGREGGREEAEGRGAITGGGNGGEISP